MTNEGVGEPKAHTQEIRGYKSPQYREITPTMFFGGIRPGYIEAIVISSKINAIDKMFSGKTIIEHTEELTLNLTPQRAKSLAAWLLKYIKYYEDVFGKAESDEEPSKKNFAVPKEIDIKKLEEMLKEV
jgi:hypothetical protein